MAGHEIWRKTLKILQNEKHTLQDLEYGERVKNVKYVKYTLQDVYYYDKTEKRGKGDKNIV